MVNVAKDEQGKVIGWIEWRQVGQSGFDKHHGEYVWIGDLWIHQDYRNGDTMNKLIRQVLIRSGDSKYCYFTRQKYNGRLSKTYTREQFMKLIEKEHSIGRI